MNNSKKRTLKVLSLSMLMLGLSLTGCGPAADSGGDTPGGDDNPGGGGEVVEPEYTELGLGEELFEPQGETGTKYFAPFLRRADGVTYANTICSS